MKTFFGHKMQPHQRRRTKWIVGSREVPSATLRQLLMVVVLIPVFAGIFLLSLWLRFEGQGHWGPDRMERFWDAVGTVVLIKVLVFAWFGVYQGWGRNVTFYDMLALVQAATASLFLTVVAERVFLTTGPIPRTVFLLDWGVTIVAIGGIRSSLRVIQERNWSLFLTPEEVPAFIVGANNSGESLLRAIKDNPKLTYYVVGFIDDDRRPGTRIGGVRVMGRVDQTCLLAQRHGVREVLIAADGLSGRQVRRLVDEARQYSVRVTVLPSYEQLITGTVRVRPRPVAIDDLLRREPVELETDNIRQWIHDRTLLVTGSAGSIGSEICRQLLNFAPRRIVLVDRWETGQFFLERELRRAAPQVDLEVLIADLLDQERMRAILREYSPDVLFHAAAYKHVPLMEAHPGEAVKNIITATCRLADLAAEADVDTFVMISTDKAVNPTSVMGTCKRVAELYVQSLVDVSDCRFVTVRFGNVLDSSGSVVQVFRQQIAAGGPVTVTDERIERYFMTIPEAARLVIQAGVIGKPGEILLLDMGDPVRIVELAADMIRLSGLKVGEDIELEVVGLRPGEKLFEELHAEGERHLPTRHPKILIADRNRRNPTAVLNAVRQIEQLANGPNAAILEELHRIVPEYGSPQDQPRPERRTA